MKTEALSSGGAVEIARRIFGKIADEAMEAAVEKSHSIRAWSGHNPKDLDIQVPRMVVTMRQWVHARGSRHFDMYV